MMPPSECPMKLRRRTGAVSCRRAGAAAESRRRGHGRGKNKLCYQLFKDLEDCSRR